jgi:5'-methylthioadenosine phosphorylase
MSDKPLLGVIGGSGLYDMPGIEDVQRVSVQTPFGLPSDDLIVGTLDGTRTVFVPRHGQGHRFTPSEVPYRANLWALKDLGCEFVLSISAVGSMKEEIEPGHFVIVDQLIDRTVGRERSFFGDGIVGHVPFGDPICPTMRGLVLDAAQQSPAPATHDGGTYICIEGPTFSTRAESHLFRSWGVSVIGMTNLPEARLAREAGMSYATVALATDYDCWHDEEEHVTVEQVLATVRQNVANAQEVIRGVARRLAADGAPQKSPYADASAHAIMTQKDTIPVDARRMAQRLFGEYLG